MKKMLKRLFVLVFASMLFITPVTAFAAVEPDWIYVDPDGGFKSFGFESSPYLIEKNHSGAIENNENNTYWRVEEGGNIMFAVNFVYPVDCKYFVVRTSPNGELVYSDEVYTSGNTINVGNLPAGNYTMYIIPPYADALISFYAVDTR